MVPSDAATESSFVAKGNPQNEIASFQAHQPQKLAISNQRANQKSTRDQPFRHSSRPTKYIRVNWCDVTAIFKKIMRHLRPARHVWIVLADNVGNLSIT